VYRDLQTTEEDSASRFEIEPELVHRAKVRVMRRAEVERLTGLSRSTLYDWMKRGEFPQPVRLGARIVAWRESDVTAWLDSRETRVA
jgi:prophage regulatory protein